MYNMNQIMYFAQACYNMPNELKAEFVAHSQSF